MSMQVGQMIEIHGTAEIPRFATEEEERAFWSTHCLAEELIVNGEGKRDPAIPFAPVRKSTRSVTLRLRPDIVRRLHELAAKKGASLQDLAGTFVAERLYEEEKREGLVN